MPNNNQNNQPPEDYQLQLIKDIQSKLMILSGFITLMRFEIKDSFAGLHKQNRNHLYILQNKAELHFYIMIIFTFFLFLKQNLRELSFVSSFLSDQNILQLLNLLFRG